MWALRATGGDLGRLLLLVLLLLVLGRVRWIRWPRGRVTLLVRTLWLRKSRWPSRMLSLSGR